MGREQFECGKREALRWKEILPCLKKMCALGDDQMAGAKKKTGNKRRGQIRWGGRRRRERS